jgi:beta-xylosidase
MVEARVITGRRHTSRGRVESTILGTLTLLLLGSFACSPAWLSAAPRAPARTFTNPVIRRNFPDPFILRVRGTYYAYATGTCDRNLQVAHSRDLVHWSNPKELLSGPAAWAATVCDPLFQRRQTWAPAVLSRAGTYVLYYTIHSHSIGRQCIDDAVSKSPEGPFISRSKRPLACQIRQDGSIDPSYARGQHGHLYLLWKNNGNCCGLRTSIYSQRLDAQGTKLLGRPHMLLSNDQPWEGPAVEAPTMWRHDGSYYLFFSGNGYNSADYAVGDVRCRGPSGPCQHASAKPILSSRCAAVGPGSEALFDDARGRTWMAYAAWLPGEFASPPHGPGRQLWLNRLFWSRKGPVVGGGSCRAQSVPATGRSR